MKKSVQRLISIFLVSLLILSSGPIADFAKIGFDILSVRAEAAGTLKYGSYTVQGKTIPYGRYTCGSASYGAGECWAFAQMIYKYIWNGTAFTSYRGTSDDMLRTVALGSTRAITATNTKDFISQAALGSVIRIASTTESLNGADGGEGADVHSLILVQKDANGLTVYDSRTSGVFVTYYTWQEFVTAWGFCKYFKYIKWPGAAAYSSNQPAPVTPVFITTQTTFYEGVSFWIEWKNQSGVNFAFTLYREDGSIVYQHGGETSVKFMLAAGKYHFVVAAYNDSGPTKYGEYYLTVVGAPTWSSMGINKKEYEVGENVNVTMKSDTASYYNLTIVKNNVVQDVILYLPSSYTIKNLTEGNYRLYMSAYNASGHIDCGYDLSFTVGKYTVAYNSNGGVDNPKISTQTKIYGADLSITTYEPTRSGYVFNGWNTKADGSGTAYAPGANYTANADLTLYAQWSAVTLSSIVVKTNPTKTSYNVGDTLNTAGLTLTATYSDGTTQTVSSGFTCSPTTLNIAGTQKITVTYQGKTATFNVAVVDNTTSAKYTVSSAKAASGGTVVLTVSIANNPGIISLRNTIAFDETALELIKVENLSLLNGYTIPSPTMSSPYTLRWADSFATANNTKNGAIVKLTFKVKDTAPKGSYTVTAVNTEARNVAGDTVAFSSGVGTVTVTDVIPGDADGDGEVTDWDAILLNRYLAGWNVSINEAACDVADNDGINDWDAIVLERYLAGWSVTLG